jgi:hypothetical protein
MLTPPQILRLDALGLVTEHIGIMHTYSLKALEKMNQQVPADHLIGMVNRLEDSGISITPYQLDQALRLAPIARVALMQDYGTDVEEDVTDALAMVFLGSYADAKNDRFVELLNLAIQQSNFN